MPTEDKKEKAAKEIKLTPTGNIELDEAIENVLFVNAGEHEDSSKYIEVKNAMLDLAEKYKAYVEFDAAKHAERGLLDNLFHREDMSKKTNAPALQQVKAAYERALQACKDYRKYKIFARATGYGAGRYRHITELQKLLERDITAVRKFDENEGKRFNEAIGYTRIESVKIDTPMKDLKIVGTDSSVHVPLSIKTSAGAEVKGYFTENYQLIDPEESYKELSEKHDLWLLGADQALFQEVFEENLETHEQIFNKDMFVGRCRTVNDKIKNYFKTNGISYDTLITDPVHFERLFRDINEGKGLKFEIEPYVKQHAATRESRRKYVNMLHDIAIIGDQFDKNLAAGGITNGTSGPERSVAVYRVAKLLGMNNIPQTYKMSLTDKEGNLRYGIFQEHVDGSDMRNLKKDDPLNGLKPQRVDGQTDTLKQLSDLDVLNYICGINRPMEDIIYNFSERQYGTGHIKNAVPEIPGNDKDHIAMSSAKGISNENSFGMMTHNDAVKSEHITPPAAMKTICKQTYEALKAMTKASLTLALSDLDLSAEEVDAAFNRAQDIVKAVDIDKKIKLIDQDKYMGAEVQKDLAAEVYFTVEGRNYKKKNIFQKILDLPNYIKKFTGDKKNKQVIEYNDAIADEKGYLVTANANFGVYGSKLFEQWEILNNLQRDLQATDDDYKRHINGASYKWLKQSVTDALNETRSLYNKYNKNKNNMLSREEQTKLAALYRQVQGAAAMYLEKHPSPRYQLGQRRQGLARHALDNVRLPLERKGIKVKSIDELIDKKDGKNVLPRDLRSAVFVAKQPGEDHKEIEREKKKDEQFKKESKEMYDDITGKKEKKSIWRFFG